MSGRIPIMPSRLEDVPAWLRYNASRLSFRVLFLADMLAEHLEHRAALEAVARETGVRLVDLPAGLTDAERDAFIREHLAADLEAHGAGEHDPASCPTCLLEQTPPQDAATRPLAADAGRLVAGVLNAALRAPVGCPHCGATFRHPSEMAQHVRDTGDNTDRERPAHACPVLWRMRGGQ